MLKSLIVITVVCIILAAAQPGGSWRRRNRRPGSGSPWSGGRGNRTGNRNMSNICSNSSLTSSFLTKAQQAIADFRANSSFTQALNNQANAVAYILNDDNVDLLSTNCTGFFSGLRQAKKLDWQALKVQRQLNMMVASALSIFNKPFRGGRYRG